MTVLLGATDIVQLPADGTGKRMAARPVTLGGQQVYLPASMLVDDAGNTIDAAATSGPVSDTARGLITRSIMQPAAQPTVTGNLTAAQPAAGTPVAGGTVDGTTDISKCGNCTVQVNGTYTGVTLTFEASVDGGTTWQPIQGQRMADGLAEASGVTPGGGNTRQWSFALPGVNRFRVRATSYSTGTAVITIDYGSLIYAPVVTAIQQRITSTQFSAVTAEAGQALTTSSALVSMVPQRAGTASAAATSIAITAQKTLRIQQFKLFVTNAASAAAIRGLATLRWNPSGATTATSTGLAQAGSGSNTATAQASGVADTVIFPDGLDLPNPGGSATFGVTIIGGAAGGLCWVSVTGYEF